MGLGSRLHTIELTDDELRILQRALHSYLDDFGHDEADLLRAIKALHREAARNPVMAWCSLRLVLWNLADSKTTIEELRRYLRDESVDAFEDVPGLRFKAWISDEATERWGAVYLWESREAADQELPSRARELIGKDPDIGEEFDVEATIEGAFRVEELSRRGLAFE